MSINFLPPECLLVIFDFLDHLDDLINCSLVCLRWKTLILDRCSKVEYLLGNVSTATSSDKVVHIGSLPKLDDLDLNQFFPELKIVDASFTGLPYWENKSRECKTIKGLIYHSFDKGQSNFGYANFIKNIEMVSTEILDFYFKNPHISQQLKQISIQNADLSIMRSITSKLHNLRRLHIVEKNCYQKLYKGVKLTKLQILEFDFDSLAGILVYPGFCFIDFCPNLESAFFHCESTYCQFNSAIKNSNLHNLVIEYCNDNPRTWSPFFRSGGISQEWETLKYILAKFPNLHRLALRNNLKIVDDDIKVLIEMFPNLVLLDVRGSHEITYKSVGIIGCHCQRNKKSIDFYYDTDSEIQFEWPAISTTGPEVCEGFDFMENCFFKSFRSLPLLMITPKEY